MDGYCWLPVAISMRPQQTNMRLYYSCQIHQELKHIIQDISYPLQCKYRVSNQIFRCLLGILIIINPIYDGHIVNVITWTF